MSASAPSSFLSCGLARLDVYRDRAVTTYFDQQSVMQPLIDSPDVRELASLAGYGDAWREYLIDREAAFILWGQWQGRPVPFQWNRAHGVKGQMGAPDDQAVTQILWSIKTRSTARFGNALEARFGPGFRDLLAYIGNNLRALHA